MFDITAADIAQLDDSDLRDLVARLCQAELSRRSASTVAVTSGGHQDAGDGGTDVRVELPGETEINGWIPRQAVVYQVKRTAMPRQKILEEMRPNGLVRESIAKLASRRGAYVIVSSPTVTDTQLGKRRAAMHESVAGIDGADALHLDFYDGCRLATWVQEHPGIVLWVREKLGKRLSGWQSFGPWSNPSEGGSSEYLPDEKLRILSPSAGGSEFRSARSTGLPTVAGITLIRRVLREPQGVARLVGLSGVGKTRLVQALFEDAIGEDPLDSSLVVYANLAESLDPTPEALAAELIALSKRAILVVDNCPSCAHSRLSQIARKSGSSISVITVEFDIKEDVPEGTEVFSLDTSSLDLIESLIHRRYPAVSATDAETIAKFSDGNARVALATAATLGHNDTIAGLKDAELLDRLIEQRHRHDPAVALAAEVCSLVHAFAIRDGAPSDLQGLGALIGQEEAELFRHVGTLRERGLVQARGIWRAVLPQVVAIRLAASALRKIPVHAIEDRLLSGSQELLLAFARRLGCLHGSSQAIEIVRNWLLPQGRLGNLLTLDDAHRDALRSVAPLVPEATLEVFERASEACAGDSVALQKRDQDVPLLWKLAYDAHLFERSVDLIGGIAIANGVTKGKSRALDAFTSLFQVGYSGTRATIDQRMSLIQRLIESASSEERQLGLKALKAALSTMLRPFGNFEFGARSRNYGFWPRSRDDANRWFSAALTLSKRAACSSSPVAQAVRETLAQELRGIWSLQCAPDEIADTCTAISDHLFWPEGWMAIRNIQYYDGAGLAPEAAERLKSIERHLRPRELLQKVRAYVLSDDHGGVSTVDERDGAHDIAASVAKISQLSFELGEAVGRDENSFSEILPELVLGQGAHLWNFGMGLAKGSGDPPKTWRRLLDALLSTPEQYRNVQVLRGYSRTLAEMNRRLTDDFLDGLLDDDRFSWLLPSLQAAAGVDVRGSDRLIASLASESIPIDNYRSLAAGIDSLQPGRLKDLILRIASRARGFEVSVDLLSTRLRDKEDPADELVTAAQDLLRDMPFATDHNASLDWQLGEIARNCFRGASGEEVTGELVRRLKRAVRNFTAFAFHYDGLISALCSAQPVATLDALIGIGAAETERGIQIIRDLRKNPLDVVSDEVLFAWCDKDSEVRHRAISSVISMFEPRRNDSEPRRWKSSAIQLLERAPDRLAILNRYISRIEPIGWTRSHSVELDSCAKLLRELPFPPDPSLQGRVVEAVEELAKEAVRQRRQEMEAASMADQRFD